MMKFIAILMALIMMFSVNVYAAEQDAPVQQDMAERSVYNIADKQITMTITDESGVGRTLTFYVKCSYQVANDSNEVHWFLTADFITRDAYLDGSPCYLKPFQRVWMESSSAYHLYQLSNSNIFIRLQIYCDEWGEVYLSAKQVHSPI